MHRSSFGVAALAVSLVVAVVGCGGAKDKPVPVEGVVLLDSQPLAGATVLFTPEDGKGPTSYGLTGDDGTFRLSCQNGVDGAFPGKYKVTITPASTQTVETPSDPKEAERMADKMMRQMASKKKRASSSKRSSTLPAEYTDERKTTLRQTVPPPEGKVTLNLTSRKR